MRASVLKEPVSVRVALTLVATGVVGVLVGLPLIIVFSQALAQGVGPYGAALLEPETRSAIALTLLTAAVVVPVNVAFGLAAAWLISRFRFRGRGLLTTLIDLPFSVSPVIAGLLFVLLFGSRGVFGPFLSAHDVHIIFAVPGIVLATTFVTFPLVAREVLPHLQSLGQAEEEAALTLGAGGFRVLTQVTLPKIKWSLAYGVILCNARAMGEFGAVSVVSGHIGGETNTLPLQVEILYNEYNSVAAFAAASLLTLLALATLVAKKVAERARREAP
jgi:sulfate transport system permease protein